MVVQRRILLLLSLFLSISCNLPSSRQTGLDENYFKKQIQELTKGRWPVSGRLAGIGEQIPGKAEWTTDINLDLSRLNVDLEKEMARNPSPGLQNYQALAEFLNARSEKARAMLTKALSTAPDNPTLVNNLAVAYLTLADESSNQLPRYLALETVDQALNNGMVTQELLTNRALILQSLHLKTQVKEAWATFLELEPSSSPWRSAALKSLAELENTPDKQWAEAKKKLVTVIAEGDQATVGEIADRFPGKTRDWMETRLLAWAEGEKRALADVEALAESFSSKDRDPIELVLAIRAAAPELKAKLAKGLALIGEPYRGSKSAAPGAERAVRESLQLFGGLEPFQSRAKYQQVRILYALGEYRTITEQTDLLATFSKRNYKRLQARLQGAMATSFGLNDDFASYYRLYHKAYDIFTLLGDRKSAARSGMNTASALTIFGAPDAALNMRTEQLSLTDYVTDPGDLALIYTGIAEDLAALGLEHAASYFFRICYELALQSGDTASTVQATRELALHLYRTGRAAEANTLLQEAFAECPKIENPEDRTEEEAKLYLTQGEMQLGELPEQAASSLITAAELFEKRGYDTHLTLLRHLLAGAQLRQSQNGAALQTVLEGIEMVEKRRPREQQQFKVSYIDQWAAGLFDQAVDLYRQEGNWLEALLTSSRARALSLADRLKPNGKTRPMPESLGEKLPPNQRIIYYHLLQERLLTWVLDGEKVLLSKAIPLDAITTRLFSGDEFLFYEKSSLSALHTLLIEPVEEALDNTDSLILIPHGALWRIPFAGLFDESRQEYLISRYNVTVCPSLRVLTFLQEAPPRNQRVETALIMGDPLHDRGLFSSPNLAHAGEEARQVAGFWKQTALFGAEVTKESFLEYAPSADLIHFAGHAQSNRRNPGKSTLWLSPNEKTGSLGRLTSEDLYGIQLSKTRLVVLSACETGGPQNSVSEGGGNLARPFLSQGVPSVVATLVPIDDSPKIGTLLERFYATWREEGNAAEAMRRAQQAAVDDGWEIKTWAAWQVFGRP